MEKAILSRWQTRRHYFSSLWVLFHQLVPALRGRQAWVDGVVAEEYWRPVGEVLTFDLPKLSRARYLLKSFPVTCFDLLIREWKLCSSYWFQPHFWKTGRILYEWSKVDKVSHLFIEAVEDGERSLEPDELLVLLLLEAFLLLLQEPICRRSDVLQIRLQVLVKLLLLVLLRIGRKKILSYLLARIFASGDLLHDWRPLSSQKIRLLLHHKQLQDAKAFSHVHVISIDRLLCQGFLWLFSVKWGVKRFPPLLWHDWEGFRRVLPNVLNHQGSLVPKNSRIHCSKINSIIFGESLLFFA